MSMNIGVSNDLDHYKEEVLPGMDVRETLYVLAAVGIGGSVIAVSSICFHIPLQLAVYLAIPFLYPVIVTGFSKPRGGLYRNDVWKLDYRRKKAKKTLLYETGENEKQIRAVRQQIRQEEKDRHRPAGDDWGRCRVWILAAAAAMLSFLILFSVLIIRSR